MAPIARAAQQIAPSKTSSTGAGKPAAASAPATPAAAPAKSGGWGPKAASAVHDGGQWVAKTASTGQAKLDAAVKRFEHSTVGDNAVGHFAGGIVSGLGGLVTGTATLVGQAAELTDASTRAKAEKALEAVAAHPGQVAAALGQGIAKAWHDDKAHFAGQVIANLIPAGAALRAATGARTAAVAGSTLREAAVEVSTQTAKEASTVLKEVAVGVKTAATSAPAAATKRATQWNVERMAQLATHKAEQALEGLKHPDYAGPAMESEEAIHSFMKETIPHVYRVRQLVEHLGGSATTHDLVERVPVEKVEALAAKLKGEPGIDASWLDGLVAKARAKNASEIEVGKLTPQVAAGLGRQGKPDRVAIELHRLSGHHGGDTSAAGHLEAAADVLDALVSPRSYKKGMSFEAATKVFWDMVEKGQLPIPDTSESRAMFEKMVKTYQTLSATVWNP